ncbi:MAG: helix-turn-helix domain-containing protein [Bacteroidota bacterium]
MLHLEFEPPEALRNTIKCFWYNRIDFGEQESNFEVVPDGYAEIIFYFGSECSIFYNGALLPLPSPFVMGLLNQTAVLRAKNCLDIIGTRCYPWTVFELLGLPPGKDSVHIIDHPIAQLQSSLNKSVDAGNSGEAIALLKQYFLDAMPQAAADNTVSKAGMAMNEAKGNMSVSRVAAAAHSTVRTLERKFRQSSGHTVKDVAGLMRFEQARNHLWLYPDTNLAGLAHELGYADQSHLSREFRRYSGTSPAMFAKNTKKRSRD